VKKTDSSLNCLVNNLLSQESHGKKIKLRETEVNKENFRPPFKAEVKNANKPTYIWKLITIFILFNYPCKIANFQKALTLQNRQIPPERKCQKTQNAWFSMGLN